MSQNIPSWLEAISDDRLRAAFGDVWQRMPAYVQPALEIDAPGVYVVDALPPPQEDALARVRVGVFWETRQSVLHMLFRREALELSGPALQGLIAHEIAHVYLRHFDNVLVPSRKQAPPEVVDFQEWHATFCAMHLFGFKEEMMAYQEEVQHAG